MSHRFLAFFLSGLLAGAALAQTPPPAAPAAAPLQFDVATIKPAPPLKPEAIAAGKLHVGMAVDGTRVDMGYLALSDMIQAAYKLKPHQLVIPDWAKNQRFDILAKMPEGSNKDQVPEMLQSLLVERFGLTFHKESREQPVFALLVGKGGPKLKESSNEEDKPEPESKGGMNIQFAGGQMRQSGNSMIVTAKDQPGKMIMTMVDGKMQFRGTKMKMEGLTAILTQFTGKPVVDMTDLKGMYDVSVDVAMSDIMAMAQKMGVGGPGMAPGAGGGDAGRPADAASDPASGGSIFSSIQAMGLKLEPRRAPVETLIVDKLSKEPTEN